MKKYRVKFRNLHAAEKNPYRPRQKIKRGPWIKDMEYDTWEDARARCEFMNRGLREAAVFIGKIKHMPNEYTGRLPETEPVEIER